MVSLEAIQRANKGITQDLQAEKDKSGETGDWGRFLRQSVKISASHVNTHQKTSITEEALNHQADTMTQPGAGAFISYHTTGMMDT